MLKVVSKAKDASMKKRKFNILGQMDGVALVILLVYELVYFNIMELLSWILFYFVKFFIWSKLLWVYESGL